MLLTAHHQQKQQQTGSWSMKWIKFFLFMTNVMFVVSSVVAIAKTFWEIVMTPRFYLVRRSARYFDGSRSAIGLQWFHRIRWWAVLLAGLYVHRSGRDNGCHCDVRIYWYNPGELPADQYRKWRGWLWCRMAGNWQRFISILQYCGLLSVVFLLEVTATLVGVHHRHEVNGFLRQSLNSSLQRYPWNSHIQKSVDFMQIEVQTWLRQR